jgi:pimeloyl-ACP methyl ester carboxylesterase
MISNYSTPEPRFSTRLAPNANWAVTARLGSSGVELELWDRTTGGFVAQETGIGIDLADQILPLGDARIVVCSSAGKLHAVDVIDRPTFSRRRVAALACQTARVLPATDGDPDGRPWAVYREDTTTTLSRLSMDANGTSCGVTSPDITLTGIYTGGVWTDHAGGSLALGHTDGGQPCSTVELSIPDGSVRTLFRVTDRSNDVFQQWAPATNLGVVSTDAGGIERLGYRHLRSGEDWMFPDELAAPYSSIEAVAVDPGGTRIIVHEQRGVRSLLHCFDVERRRSAPLPVMPGTLHGHPVWTMDGLFVPWSTPEVPLTFLEYGPGAGTEGALALRAPVPVSAHGGAVAVSLPGAGGPIEAIAWGGPDWLHLPTLVVALHGGPLEAWRLTFDPLFDQLARSGVGVLALNPRGSTGYGYSFASAIRCGWGGADLDDVLAVSRFLRSHREPGRLGLFGLSYGAFLALLAACLEPGNWDFCAALSGFASPVRLYEGSDESVRRLIAHTGGLKAPPGLDSPWDVRELAHWATARILMVHGRYDETIAVRHARELAAVFASASGKFGPRALYQEMPHAGHDLNWPGVWDLVCRFIKQPHKAI